MNAFEHQVAQDVLLHVGPERPIDAMAIVRSVKAQDSKWRFQTMFSATKFVAAGAIVALFGGFLLAGVLTQQSVKPLPAGASASPAPSPPGRVRLPAELPDGVESGTLDTPLGSARWVHLEEGPAGLSWWLSPLPAPGGFITADNPPLERRVRLWRSPDLGEWTPETLTIDVANPRLVMAGGMYWLFNEGSAVLWRSEDTVTWQQIDLSELTPPFPEFLDDRIRVSPGAGPVGSADVTIVQLDFSAGGFASDLGLTGLSGDWWLESAEPGVYEATGRWGNTRGIRVHTRLRFEETDTGLRVIDATDEAELARLDGVGMEFIERWVERGSPWGISQFAIIEANGLKLIDGPWSPEHDIDLYGTAAGFFAYGRTPDSDLIDVWRSADGVTWAESEPLGDDPGEPTGAVDMRVDPNGGPLSFTLDGRGWTSSDGLTWQESEYPEFLLSSELEQMSVRMASGWVTMSKDELSFKGDGDDRWAAADVTELGIDSYADEWKTPELAEEFGIDSYAQVSRVYGISPDTIAFQIGFPTDPSMGRVGLWILTFDDLPE